MSQRFMRFSMLAILTPSGVLHAIWGSWVLLLPTIPLIITANVFKFRASLPSVPYAWQLPNETIEISSSRSSRLNVLGFLNTDNLLHPFIFECSVDSDIVIACFDCFCKTITKKTVVVLDNAPIHKSQKFNDNIERWESKGLFIKRLPNYSPELNLIEILWKFIKYHWLPFSAYRSFKDLVNEVENILRGIGSKFRINFSQIQILIGFC